MEDEIHNRGDVDVAVSSAASWSTLAASLLFRNGGAGDAVQVMLEMSIEVKDKMLMRLPSARRVSRQQAWAVLLPSV